MDTTYSISDLAAEFGLTPRTLRWYEDEGLLRPERNGSHRVFSTRDRTRLRLILRGKRLGFSLAEIREIVEMYDAAPGERGQLLTLLRRIEEHRNDLGARMHDLQRTLADLDEVEQRARDRLGELASDPD
jgi:DNA-binding transcriptional MerR regulator